MHRLLCFLLISLHGIALCAQSISEKTAYPAFCQAAADDPLLFKDFKRHPDYQIALEHLSFEEGALYLKFLKQRDPDILLEKKSWKKNDRVGNPIVYAYPTIGKVSPTTLRYLKVVSDLRNHFGDLSQLRIVEIGGGYGGQCQLIASLGGFKSYTIVDLPPCIALAKCYLKAQQIENVTCLNHEELDQAGEYDLLISNYAFSELDWIEQQIYLESLFETTPMGYITYNHISHLFGMRSMTVAEVCAFLTDCNRRVEVARETPSTHPENQIITWVP